MQASFHISEDVRPYMIAVLTANRAYVAKTSRSFGALHHYSSAEMFGWKIATILG